MNNQVVTFVVGGDVVSLAQDGKLGSFNYPLYFNLKKQKKMQGIPPFLDILNFGDDDNTRASIKAWT